MRIRMFCALALLGSLAASCGKQLDVAADVALKHQNGAAVQRQIELLQAEQVKVSAATTGAAGAGLAVLSLVVVNPTEQPHDTLKQRVRHLAHLLVLDLKNPAAYQVVNAQATFKPGFLSKDQGASSQAFIYPLASLK